MCRSSSKFTDGRGGGSGGYYSEGKSKSYNGRGEKAWSSLKHSILSALYTLCVHVTKVLYKIYFCFYLFIILVILVVKLVFHSMSELFEEEKITLCIVFSTCSIIYRDDLEPRRPIFNRPWELTTPPSSPHIMCFNSTTGRIKIRPPKSKDSCSNYHSLPKRGLLIL